WRGCGCAPRGHRCPGYSWLTAYGCRCTLLGMPLIATRALPQRYPGALALDSLDLELEPGIIGLVGANGAGKSTLIKILLGLLDATSGSAEMLGYDVVREGTDLRQFVGYMPEHDCLPVDISATEFVAHMAQINGLPK